MDTPPYYRTARFLPRFLFRKYIDWCFLTEQRWNKKPEPVIALDKVQGRSQAYSEKEWVNREHSTGLYSCTCRHCLGYKKQKYSKYESWTTFGYIDGKTINLTAYVGMSIAEVMRIKFPHEYLLLTPFVFAKRTPPHTTISYGDHIVFARKGSSRKKSYDDIENNFDKSISKYKHQIEMDHLIPKELVGRTRNPGPK